VALTEAGKHLLERLQPALGGVNLALEEMNMFRASPAGTLRINSSRDAAVMVIGPLIGAIWMRIPISRWRSSATMAWSILSTVVSIWAYATEHVPEDMIAVPVWGSQRFVVVGSPDYFARHGKPQHRRSGAPQLRALSLPARECLQVGVGQGRYQAGGGCAGALVGRRFELATRAALDGVVLTFLPEFRLRPHIEAGGWCWRWKTGARQYWR
jgi:DNA-binding transcriptional LysR family regulator